MSHSGPDGRVSAIQRARDTVDSGQFRAELAKLVAFATESQNPAQRAELDRYLHEAMQPRFKALGFDCVVYENPDAQGGPLLLATRIEGTGLPTVIGYGHGDVVFGQAESWRRGLVPFDVIADGDRLYGRGTADNKAQHLINLMAMERVIETRGLLGFNAKVLIEMSEETGSAGLDRFCRDNRDALSADLLIASDGPRVKADTATLFTGARGVINFDLNVDLRTGAHHSGNWGGLLADPAIVLAHAIATITDARGQIAIPEWRPDSLTAEVRDVLSALPPMGDEGPDINPDWGEADLSPAERVYGWNSFAVLAMKSGVPDAPVNAIDGSARATCQLRFVVGTDVDDILPALRRHLDRNGFENVEITAADRGYFPATRLTPDHPYLRFAAESIRQSTGRSAHILPNLAGSLPNHCFAEILGLPTIWVPHSYRGCSQHAPDEHVLLPVCRDALGVMAGLYWDIGAGPLPALST